MRDNSRDEIVKVGKRQSLTVALIAGTGWSIGIRWASRILGILSLAICARILTPADYGLVSMGMVVVGFSNILIQFGIDASLIREQHPTPAIYNSAWSLRILQGTAIAVIVLISAPVASYFYKDDRVIPIMLAVGLAGLFGSFQNIYVVNFRKNLDFQKDFLFNFIPRLVSFFSAISAVVILKTYWGLVIGICVAEIARTIMSYLVIKERARWNLNEWRGLTHFSGWYFARGLGEFLTFEFDRFILGTLAGARQTGLYSVAREISALPSTEIVLPIGRALLPTLSILRDQPSRLIAAIEKAITGTMIVAAPAALGFALIAHELILILFGNDWLEAAPLVMIFSVSAMLSGFRDTVANVFVVTGQIRTSAILTWMQAFLILGLYYPAYSMGGLVGVAWLYVITIIAMSLLYAHRLHGLGLVKGRSLWVGIARPIASAILMYIAVDFIAEWPEALPIIAALAFKVTLGIIVYSLALTSLWFLSGSPVSSEKALLDLASNKTKLLLNRFK